MKELVMRSIRFSKVVEKIDQRLLLAAFEHRHHEGPLLIVRTDQRDQIGMPFEKGDFHPLPAGREP